MAGNRIEAWLKLRDRARFRRDARGAADDIREIKEAARETDDAASGMADTFKEWLSSAPEFGSRTRVFGFAIGTVLTAGIAAIPVMVGLGGAVVALAGSFTLAAIGAGLLAGALGGVLLAGLAGVGIVAFNAIQNFQKVNTRFEAWRQAVAAFGKDSKQAQTAFSNLSGAVKENGGPVILEAVQAWQQLRKEFEKAMAPALDRIWMGVLAVFDALRQLLPTLSKFVSIVLDGLNPVMVALLNFFTSAEFKNSVIAIANTFSQIAGPIGIGLVWVLQGILRLVVRMLPFLLPVARGFESIAENFAVWAKTGDLTPFISQLKSWWHLLKAAGGLLVTVLGGGADSGQNLVDSLANVLDKWNAFLRTSEGKSKMADFFHDAVDMTKAFAGFLSWITAALFKFGAWALPAYTKFFNGVKGVWNDFMDALAPAKPFWDNILKPFLTGLATGVMGGIVGAFKFLIGVLKIVATVLGWIGSTVGPRFKGVFELIGKVIGFVFGGAILRVLSWLGKLSVVLRPIGWLFSKLAIPITWAGKAVGFLFGWIGKIIGIFGRLAGRMIPWVRTAFSNIISFLRGLGGKFFDAGVWLWNRLKSGILKVVGQGLGFAGDLAKAVANAVIKLLNSAIPNSIPIPGPAPNIDLPNNPIPTLAMGGVVSGVGSWITGEAGPELNTLRGGRVTVQPLPAISTPDPSRATLDSGRGRETRVTKIYLRGKQIAEAVADEADDEAARA